VDESYYFSVIFKIRLNDSELPLFCENILSSVRKLHILNSHLGISLYQFNSELNDYEEVLELSSYYLASPVAGSISEYFQKEFNVGPEGVFTYKDTPDCADFETIILFIDSNANINTIDLILTTRRLYNSKNIKHITNIFNSETFREILNDNSIKFKKLESVSRLLISR
jgi:hypothetical protein